MVRMGAQESPDPDTAPHAAPPAADASATGLPGSPLLAICPYVLVPSGGYRFAHPDREHRCTAARPFEPLSNDKQRRLCLTAGYDACPTIIGARERRHATLADAGIPIDGLQVRRSRPLGHTTPVVLVGGHRSQGTAGMGSPGGRLPQSGTRRSGGPDATTARAAGLGVRPDATGGRPGSVRGGGTRGSRVPRAVAGPAVAAVVVLAAVAVLVARLPGAAGPSPSTPAALATTAPSVGAGAVSQLPTVGPTVAASPATTTAVVSAPPTPSPAAATPPPSSSASRTYRVKAGDTLTGIAARFGVTVSALQQANGITDPRLLRIGQELQIP